MNLRTLTCTHAHIRTQTHTYAHARTHMRDNKGGEGSDKQTDTIQLTDVVLQKEGKEEKEQEKERDSEGKGEDEGELLHASVVEAKEETRSVYCPCFPRFIIFTDIDTYVYIYFLYF